MQEVGRCEAAYSRPAACVHEVYRVVEAAKNLFTFGSDAVGRITGGRHASSAPALASASAAVENSPGGV